MSLVSRIHARDLFNISEIFLPYYQCNCNVVSRQYAKEIIEYYLFLHFNTQYALKMENENSYLK